LAIGEAAAGGMAAAPYVAFCVVLVFAAASFFFSLAETSLFSLSKWQVRQLAEREPRGGGRVARLLAEPQDLLATIALGNSVASAAMLAVGLWMALHDHWPLVAHSLMPDHYLVDWLRASQINHDPVIFGVCCGVPLVGFPVIPLAI
jgi:CBS domain containing-hemolysin-like protein